MRRCSQQRGFTLIEMVGVLAIVALLAGMLVPRIFKAVRQTRVQHVVQNVNTLRAAVAAYFAKHGTLQGLVDFQETYQQSPDHLLVQEGFLDKPFETKFGKSPDPSNERYVYILTQAGLGPPDFRYDLDGDGTKDTANAKYVMEVRLYGVSKEDAQLLSQIIDGEDLTPDPDHVGRVIRWTNDADYPYVFIYIAHE